MARPDFESKFGGYLWQGICGLLLIIIILLLLGARSHSESERGFRARVPDLATQKQVMRLSGNTRYTFEFEKGKVPQVEVGDELQIQITRKPK